ncbi:MAG: YHS domain-containing protein [Kistimonas sp.]|nr:YHS domain-containing protein [Kistimonas sp.]
MSLGRFVFPVWILLGLLLGSSANADTNTGKIYTGFFSNLALGGYDPVAYFPKGDVQGGPVKGKKTYSWEWQGAQWYFSSQENKELFQANPHKYAPEYGGHCAWAVGAKNSLVKGNPKYWTLKEGKLYLNYNRKVQKLWEQDPDAFIEKGNKNWPGLNR